MLYLASFSAVVWMLLALAWNSRHDRPAYKMWGAGLTLLWGSAFLLPEFLQFRLNISAPLLGAFGAAALLLLVHDQLRKSAPTDKAFLPFWAFVLGVLGSTHLVAATVDHYAFGLQDGEVGIANVDFFEEAKVPCHGIVLVRMDQSTVHYRCPTGISLGGFMAQQPFVPWPDYTSGDSEQLRSELIKLRAKAIRVVQDSAEIDE